MGPFCRRERAARQQDACRAACETSGDGAPFACATTGTRRMAGLGERSVWVRRGHDDEVGADRRREQRRNQLLAIAGSTTLAMMHAASYCHANVDMHGRDAAGVHDLFIRSTLTHAQQQWHKAPPEAPAVSCPRRRYDRDRSPDSGDRRFFVRASRARILRFACTLAEAGSHIMSS